mgnify:CR=1 FL=1
MFVCKDAYKKGHGKVEHNNPIQKPDVEKLYSSIAFNVNTSCGLLNKVWFELCMYFCRRGNEHQRDLTALMFDTAVDADGKKYVYQTKSEISKNHQGMSSNEIEDINVRMYGSLCPVKSFQKYLQKRIQKRKALFQTPRMSWDGCRLVWKQVIG